ncbi:MAG: hypothetical protein KJ880_01265 [Candidatus Omnitrophica bacterium]|nr:hypothetical protein [Candidatus Omnitrophota bacterium]MBU1870395.1 hypothetical protein [Candidatus Omnitrophota bacterium]
MNRMFPRTLILMILFFALSRVFAAAPGDSAFTNFINNDTDGSSFEQAVVLNDECDYSGCKTVDCLDKVFSETVFSQELKYAADNYGVRGKDWDVVGFDEVDAYVFDDDKYYDDLGVQLMATGESRVLHFDVTSSVNALDQQKYNL